MRASGWGGTRLVHSAGMGATGPGSTLAPTVGQTVTVSVDGADDGGMSWEPAITGSSIVYVSEDLDSSRCKPGAVGCSPKHIFTFKAVSPGKSLITLNLQRGSKVYDSQQYPVNVVSEYSVGPNINAPAGSQVDAAAGMVEQAWGQLSQAAAAGADEQALAFHKATLERLGTELHALQDDAGRPSTDMVNWNARAARSVNDASDELKAVVKLNRGELQASGTRGLLWGLGVAAVVAAAGYFVWRKKSRRRG